MDELDDIAARVRAREGGATVGPWTLEVYPTLRCNLDCAFCDTTDRHRPAVHELDADTWSALVDEAADLGARRIYVLGGGEPLVSAATPAILRRAKARGLTGMLTTNGTRLDAKTATLLVDIGWDEVHVSLDGARPATHDLLRGKSGAFQRTVTGTCRLRRLRDQRGERLPRIVLHTVITRRNLREIPAIVRLAAALGADAVEFDALVAYRPEQRALRLDTAEEALLPDLAREGIVVAESLDIRTTLPRFLTPEDTRRGENLPPPATRAGSLGRAPCLKAWHHLVIDAAGRISACCVLAGEGERVTTVAETWERSPWLVSLREARRAGAPLPRCAECSPNLLAHEAAIGERLAAPRGTS